MDVQNSIYGPFIDVGGVCLDVFIVDHNNLKSKFLNERKELLKQQRTVGQDDLLKDKKDIAAVIGDLSRKCGSFWISLERDGSTKRTESIRDEVISAARSLFLNVPDSIKSGKLAADSSSGKIGRGYLPWGSESGANGIFEIKEGFAFGYNWNANDRLRPSNPMEELNKWPCSVTNPDIAFTTTERKLLEEETVNLMNDIGNLLLRAYSLDLHNDENKLPEIWSGGETWNLTRIFRYFSGESIDKQHNIKATQKMGSSPHTDWGLLTVIMACDEPGLQLLDSSYNESDEKYITVLPRFHENKLFVNCGDFMSIMSNGKYLSPKHRVISPKPKANCPQDVERTSIVHFFYPRYDVRLPPVKELSPYLQEKYSVFADQREVDQIEPGTECLNNQDDQLLFGDVIAAKWTQVARKT